MRTRYALSWLVYGLVVFGSGGYRYLSRPGGEKGLWFGLVLGAIAIAAAWLLRAGRERAGNAAAFTSVGVVTGWCLYESLVKDGGSRETRLLLVAAIGLVQIAIAIAHLRARPRPAS